MEDNGGQGRGPEGRGKGRKGKGEGERRDRGKGREGKENGHRPPTIFGLKVALFYLNHVVSAFIMLLCGSHTKLDHYASFVLVTINVLKCFFSIADMTCYECCLNSIFQVLMLYFLTLRGALKPVLVRATIL